MNTEFLFVYGSLRPDISRNMIDLYRGSYMVVGPAAIPGNLYDLGLYPGLKTGGEGRVSGIILELLHPDVLSSLDKYEGYSHDDPMNSLFIRKKTRANRPGKETICWLYEYNKEVAENELIPSGDWKKHLSAR